MTNDFTDYFAGTKLYGDDFSIQEIEAWFKDETDAYAELGAKDRSTYRYAYTAMNQHHGYRFLPPGPIEHVLGLGSAYGDEFLPLAHRLRRITILDPSDSFTIDHVAGVPCRYVKPRTNGDMPFDDASFDLITCFGVLHHIAKCHRCLRPAGTFLVREPITSMGDWRRPRAGLTKRERGIPIKIFHEIIAKTGFRVRRGRFCVFPVITKLAAAVGIAPFNHRSLTALDSVVSRAFSWNDRYHRTRVTEKFGPQAVYFVLEKPVQPC
jgi:SAM-dependent methyltransferase